MTEDVIFAVGGEVSTLQAAALQLRYNACAISITCWKLSSEEGK